MRCFRRIWYIAALLLLGVCGHSQTRFYWENPESFTSDNAHFPSTAQSEHYSVLVWEEADTARRQIYLSAKIILNDEFYRNPYADRSRFIGPVEYSGEVPDIYSMAVGADGTLVIAVADVNTIKIYTSTNAGGTFTEHVLKKEDAGFVAPRIYRSSQGFILFAAHGRDESFSISYARSQDGLRWTEFEPFAPAAALRNPLFPSLVITPSGNDLVLMQAQFASGNRYSFQLYSTVSGNGGRTWSAARLVSGEQSVSGRRAQSYDQYNNQRPALLSGNGTLHLAWERSAYTSENAGIWTAELDEDGSILNPVQVTDRGNASRPVLFMYGGSPAMLWFDTRRGVEGVYFARKQGAVWEEDSSIPSSSAARMFPCPVIVPYVDELLFLWQQDRKLFVLAPDSSVAPPRVVAGSFTEGLRSSSEKASASVVLPDDSSGIDGYSWVWTRNPDEEPPETLMEMPSNKRLSATADEDGTWYFKVRVLDYAGNWSESSVLEYVKDTTAPKKPVISRDNFGEDGFVVSNTFSMRWSANPEDDDVAGYTWSLAYTEALPRSVFQTPYYRMSASEEECAAIVRSARQKGYEAAETLEPPPRRLISGESHAEYNNLYNGMYLFSVAAIDTAGNIGEAAVVPLLLNKFVPATKIGAVTGGTDREGTTALSIMGEGFSYDGRISALYLDRDGQAPYDRILRLQDGDFKVNSDSSITGISVQDLEEGTYRVGLLHPERGLYWSEPRIQVDPQGKLRRYFNPLDFEPPWQAAPADTRLKVNSEYVVYLCLLLLLLLGILAAAGGLAYNLRESAIIRQEVIALLEGELMPEERRERVRHLRNKGLSLKWKMVLFTVVMIFLVVDMVVGPLGVMMVSTQKRTLAKGLEDRVNVLMESLSTGARTYLPTANVLELSALPGQSSAMEEAEYVTITGFNAEGSSTSLDYVWATNDPDIMDKIDSGALNFGETKIVSEDIAEVSRFCAELEARAAELVRDDAEQIARLNAERASLPLGNPRRDEINTITTELYGRISDALNGLAFQTRGAYPAFSSQSLDSDNTEYLFFTPVIYRQGNEPTYVRGIVYLKLRTDTLIKEISDSTRLMLLIAGAIAAVGIVLGAAGAVVLARIIVNPIRALVGRVELIARTSDLSKLEGQEIERKSNDEIGRLVMSINEMTEQLAEAGKQNDFISEGKDIQRAFVALDSEGSRKVSVGHHELAQSRLFVYYEGAKGVSGDYFNCQKLDATHFLIMKGDVSGKGVVASLICAQVANVVTDYIKNWSFKKDGYDISKLVYKINDTIEALQLNKKFIAFTLCIYDSAHNDFYFCNAGDNIIHYYDSAERRKKLVRLQETPAAGPMPSFMIEMKNGYPTNKMHFNKGDMLFLYTDGIEEAKRIYKDSAFRKVRYRPGTDTVITDKEDQNILDGEEMSPERVDAIIEAIMSRGRYRLVKQKSPVSNMPDLFEFDFSSCAGTPEDIVYGLVAVEKVFRMYKIPDPTEFDTVQVDKKIDAFLRKHFVQYDQFCSEHSEHPHPNMRDEYMIYRSLLEDEQFDDLTVAAIKIG